MKKFLGIISALLLAACTDYVDDFEGKYEKTLGSEEAFLESLNKNEWEWNKVCNSGDWFWCYNTEDGYNSKNDGIIKEYSTGSATILFTKTNDNGYENVVNELGSDLLPILRHDGGIGFSMFGGRDGDHVGVKVPISNFDIFKENNLLLAYENGCSGATINLVVEAGKNYMFRGSEIKAGTPIFQFSKEVPVSGYQVLEFNPDKFDVEVGETNWIMVDDILKNEGSGKYATYVSVDLSKDCPDDKKIVLVGVGIKPYTRNISKSSSSSNGGSSVKSSSSNKGGSTTSSSSTEKIELAKNAVTCEPEVGQIKVGESVKWKFTMSSETIKLIPEIDRMAIHSAWTFEGADKSSSAKDGPSTVSYDITYSTTGTKKATLDFTAGKYHGTYTCSTLNVVASGISSSSIAKSSSSSAKSSSSVASSSSTVQGFLWDGSDLRKFVKTDFGTGTDWYSFTDAKDDGGSTTINPQNPVDSLFDICWGNCGMVHYGSDYVNPYASTGFDLDNQGKTYDVSDWEGLCIAYESDAPVILRLTPSKATAGDYGYDFPEKTLPASQSGAVNIMSFAWDKFLQNGWSDTKISGEEIAKILKGVEISFRGTAGESQYFNIRQVGSKGKCSPQLNPRGVDMALFDKYPDAVVTAIAESDVIWYGGSKLNGEDSYLKQALFATELPWVSDSAKKYVKWNPKIEDNVISDRLVKLCGGGVCGTIVNEEIPDNAYLDVGFPIADGVDISGWGGVCLTYSTTSDSLKLYLGLGDEEGGNGVAIGFDWYRAYLAPSASDTTVCIPWQNFVQGGYGTAVKLDWYLPKVKDVSFEFQHKAGSKFNISAVGTYKENVDAFNEYMADKNNRTSAWQFLNPELEKRYVEFKDDRDQQVYKSIRIGRQTWMAENLNYETANSYCYDNDPANCALYGRLYKWSVAMDSAGAFSNMGKGCGDGKTCTPMEPVPGICPDGWHLPSWAEIDTLLNYVGIEEGAYDLKSQFGWAEGGSDMYGFSAVPAGVKYDSFYELGVNSGFLASSEANGSGTTHARGFELVSSGNGFGIWVIEKDIAVSVRCVKTDTVPTGINPTDLIWYGGKRLKEENMFVQSKHFKDYIWANNVDQSSITFGTKVINGSIPDPLILRCGGGICGRVKGVVEGDEPGFSFDISDEVTNVADWGGICVTYIATNDSLSLYLGTGGSGNEFSQSISFDFYRVYLPKAEKTTTKCYDWTKFKQRGSGTPVKLDVYLPRVHDVSFQFREESGNMTFNIFAVGKYTDGKADYDTYMADKANRTSAWDYLSEAHASQYIEFPDDRDGQRYKAIKIGNQTWMAENLNYDMEGSSCYDNDSLNCKVYGRLYTWEAAQNACPDEWMLPSKADWDALLNAAAAGSTSSKAMKSSHPLSGWDIEDPGADAVGFSSLPGGEFAPGEGFVHMNDYAFFWTATIAFDDNVETAYWNDIDNNGANISFRSKENGFSVRCIKTGSKYNATANTLTDFRDNKVYETVEIGDQVWMAENLNYVYPGKTADEDSSSFCFNNVGDNCGEYGRLYMWSAAMDSAGLVSGNVANGCGYGTTCSASEKHRGVCPAGWHLPSEEEFGALISAVDGAPAGLKTTSGWHNDGDGTNSSGFSAKPSSYRGSNGYYGMAASDACFWSSTERGDGARTFDVYLSYDSGSGLGTGGAGEDKRYSCAVRCVKD